MAQTLTGAQARWELTGNVTSTGVNSTGVTGALGTGLVLQQFDTADILFAFKVTCTAAADVVTWNMGTGDLTKTTGTPDVTRWGTQTGDTTGEDFEGINLATITTMYGFVIDIAAANSKYLAIAGVDPEYVDVPQASPGQVISQTFRSGESIVTPPNMTFTHENDAAAIGDTYTVTVLGKA